jgi:hypothetical protein
VTTEVGKYNMSVGGWVEGGTVDCFPDEGSRGKGNCVIACFKWRGNKCHSFGTGYFS